MPDTEKKRVPDHRTDVLKRSILQGPHALPRNTEISEYSILSEESEKER